MLSFEQRQEAERLREEREGAAKVQPVVITGVSIPFWRLVWWIVAVTGGVSLINALFDLVFRVVSDIRVVN